MTCPGSYTSRLPPACRPFLQPASHTHCFQWLDAPVKTIGATDLPAIPLNETLEKAMLPSPEKIAATITELLAY